MIVKFNKNIRLKPKPTWLLSQTPKVLVAYLVLFPVFYFFVDRQLAFLFASLSDPFHTFAVFLSKLINPDTYFIWVPLAYFYVRYMLRRDSLASLLFVLMLTVPLANVADHLVKFGLVRDHPDMLLQSGQYGFHLFSGVSASDSSFPSSQAVTAGAAAGTLACFYPRRSIHIALCALFISFSVVLLDLHFLSDILAGLLLGIIVSQSMYALMQKDRLQIQS